MIPEPAVRLADGLASAIGWLGDSQLLAGESEKATLGASPSAAYTTRMAKVQQTFSNNKDSPIYVSVEPWPECFELEPGDKLTLIWDAPESGDAAQIDFINERELVVWPNGETHEMKYLINGEEAEARSWTFKHK